MSEEILQVLVEGYDPNKVVKAKEEVDQNWKKVYGAYQNNTILQAVVVGIEKLLSKQCAVVQLGDVRGYIPMEFTGVEDIRQLRALTGKDVAFKVLNYDRDAGIFTGSRTDALKQMAETTLRLIKEGDTIIAVARSVSQTLVRADIGGIEVKIPIEDVKYGWIDDLTEEIKVGDHLNVKVLVIDKENQAVEVSAKATQENPWNGKAQRYQRGSEYVGVVSGVREYGVFVNLESGIDSLAPHLKYQNVKIGDRVLVRVLNVNAEKEQIRSRITRVL